MMAPITFTVALTPESAEEFARLVGAYGASVANVARGGSRFNSRLVTSQIDDDVLRRLINAIEDACGVHDDERPPETVVAECIDGDLFLAYQETRDMFRAAYPDLYGDDDA